MKTYHKTNTDNDRRDLVLHIIQPGLAGFLDGSISSLAPVFAAASLTHNSHTALIVGIATAAGAGISMTFSEALSDDGKLSGRGNPYKRGLASGVMTFLGAIGHSLPFLIGQFQIAITVALAVVLVELITIAWLRHYYMNTGLPKALLQVLAGGVLVFLAGIFIGKS